MDGAGRARTDTGPAPLFAALGDAMRLALVRRLAATLEPLSISALSAGTGLTRQAVTRHLQVLEAAGLVRSARAGRECLYIGRAEGLAAAAAFLDDLVDATDTAAEAVKDIMNGEPPAAAPESQPEPARGPDAATLAAYDRGAAGYAADWHGQPPPSDMHALLHRFFAPGPTADIGCGSGRDTAWLAANGWPAAGWDASEGLLAEARARYPHLRFAQATLPALDGIARASFANVLCETVIMHLPRAGIAPSVARLMEILKPGGTLYLSWRVAAGADRRDADGRLYTAFEPALVRDALGGAETLYDETVDSDSSGQLVQRVVARKA